MVFRFYASEPQYVYNKVIQVDFIALSLFVIHNLYDVHYGFCRLKEVAKKLRKLSSKFFIVAYVQYFRVFGESYKLFK